jgi:hypothetical protein
MLSAYAVWLANLVQSSLHGPAFAEPPAAASILRRACTGCTLSHYCNVRWTPGCCVSVKLNRTAWRLHLRRQQRLAS